MQQHTLAGILWLKRMSLEQTSLYIVFCVKFLHWSVKYRNLVCDSGDGAKGWWQVSWWGRKGGWGMQRERGCERKNHPHHVSGGCGRQLPENHISPILRSVVNQTLQNLLQRSLATDFNQILLLLPGCWGCCCCCCNNRRIVILLLEWVAAVYTRPHERL